MTSGAPIGDDGARLSEAVARMLDGHWVDGPGVDAPGIDGSLVKAGYAAPNTDTYPWQWLWDSCFHALIWDHLGDDRANIELASCFVHQLPSGFVPHMSYRIKPETSKTYWGRRGASSITQPPMFGHTIAQFVRNGREVDPAVVDAAAAGLRFLMDRRRIDGLVSLCHPWETGADDSPRWDDFCAGGYHRVRWAAKKTALLNSIVRDRFGSALGNPAFAVGSAGFSALVAYNSIELASVTGDADLATEAGILVASLDERFDDGLGTWVDGGPDSPMRSVRNVYDLLPLLVTELGPEATGPVCDALIDPAAFGGACGPAAVHRDEPTFDPVTYWRGPSWPQLSYLLWRAAVRCRP